LTERSCDRAPPPEKEGAHCTRIRRKRKGLSARCGCVVFPKVKAKKPSLGTYRMPYSGRRRSEARFGELLPLRARRRGKEKDRRERTDAPRALGRVEV